MKTAFTLNGKTVALDVEPDEKLAGLLRDRCGLTATKTACEIGRCGACSVTMDGQLVNACLVLAWKADGSEIVTSEGLDEDPEARIVRRALAEENAFQCGYCAPGFTIALVALLKKNPDAGEAEIRAGLAGNICRCTGYHSIIRGALAAARALREAADGQTAEMEN